MLSVLTYPSYSKQFKAYMTIKERVKTFLTRPRNNYLGHPAVVRSLINGLDQLHFPYNFNPASYRQLGEHVHVLSGVDTLKFAIKLKRRKIIRKLTAGPNIVISSADCGGLVSSPEIDKYVVNSEWTQTAYLIDNPNLNGRIGYFPSGIDGEYWNIQKSSREDLRLAFYNKRPEPLLYNECMQIAKQFSASITEIIYGNYRLEELKKTLEDVDFVIYFVEQESQGIVLAEIWGTNTPTIVWNPGFWHYKMKNYKCSSAPYLTDQTGLFFRTADDFKKLFEEEALKADRFTPRKWVLNNMTDRICAERFIKVISEL